MSKNNNVLKVLSKEDRLEVDLWRNIFFSKEHIAIGDRAMIKVEFLAIEEAMSSIDVIPEFVPLIREDLESYLRYGELLDESEEGLRVVSHLYIIYRESIKRIISDSDLIESSVERDKDEVQKEINSEDANDKDFVELCEERGSFRGSRSDFLTSSMEDDVLRRELRMRSISDGMESRAPFDFEVSMVGKIIENFKLNDDKKRLLIEEILSVSWYLNEEIACKKGKMFVEFSNKIREVILDCFRDMDDKNYVSKKEKYFGSVITTGRNKEENFPPLDNNVNLVDQFVSQALFLSNRLFYYANIYGIGCSVGVMNYRKVKIGGVSSIDVIGEIFKHTSDDVMIASRFVSKYVYNLAVQRFNDFVSSKEQDNGQFFSNITMESYYCGKKRFKREVRCVKHKKISCSLCDYSRYEKNVIFFQEKICREFSRRGVTKKLYFKKDDLLSFCDRANAVFPTYDGMYSDFIKFYAKINRIVRYLRIDLKVLRLLTFHWTSGYKDVRIGSPKYNSVRDAVGLDLKNSDYIMKIPCIEKM